MLMHSMASFQSVWDTIPSVWTCEMVWGHLARSSNEAMMTNCSPMLQSWCLLLWFSLRLFSSTSAFFLKAFADWQWLVWTGVCLFGTQHCSAMTSVFCLCKPLLCMLSRCWNAINCFVCFFHVCDCVAFQMKWRLDHVMHSFWNGIELWVLHRARNTFDSWLTSCFWSRHSCIQILNHGCDSNRLQVKSKWSVFECPNGFFFCGSLQLQEVGASVNDAVCADCDLAGVWDVHCLRSNFIKQLFVQRRPRFHCELTVIQQLVSKCMVWWLTQWID